MSSVETTALKLKHSPTGGVDASHSLNWRDDLSSGVKGLYQGALGGASLYGAIGLAIGCCLALIASVIPALAAIPALAGGTWVLIPVATGLGIVKGASTFGSMGSTAAIVSEALERSERRRILLDRYAELPKGHEGDKEAAAIVKQLTGNRDEGPAPPFFHWKTVAMCAVIGAAIMMGFSFAAPAMLAQSGIIHSIGLLVGHGGVASSVLGMAGGALTGGVIGIDRYYVRKWFDHTESVVHSGAHQALALDTIRKQTEHLKVAAIEDEKTKMQLRGNASGIAQEAPAASLSATTPTGATMPATNPEKPTHTVNHARREGLMKIHEAMGIAH